jgi:hypothetical protein
MLSYVYDLAEGLVFELLIIDKPCRPYQQLLSVIIIAGLVLVSALRLLAGICGRKHCKRLKKLCTTLAADNSQKRLFSNSRNLNLILATCLVYSTR